MGKYRDTWCDPWNGQDVVFVFYLYTVRLESANERMHEVRVVEVAFHILPTKCLGST